MIVEVQEIQARQSWRLAARIDMDDLRSGIEENWWPRMVDGTLVCELREDGVEANAPNPYTRTELEPFIKAYNIAVKGETQDDASELYRRFQRSRGMLVGSCGVVTADRSDFADANNEDSPIAEYQPRVNSVALVRAPRMVVQYLNARGGNDVAGVYVASEDFDKILKLAEPPTHERWSSTSSRLEGHEHVTTVKGLPNRIYGAVRDLRTKMAGPTDEVDQRPRALERMFGRLLRSTGPARPTVPHGRGPYKVIVDNRHENVGQGNAVVRGTAEIELRPNQSIDDVETTVTVNARFVVDDNETREDVLRAGFTRVTYPNVSVDGRPSNVGFNLQRGRMVKCSYETDEFDDYCSVELTVTANESAT